MRMQIKAGAAVLAFLCLSVFADDMLAYNKMKEEIQQPDCGDIIIEACPMNYDPLCGTDGETYANECLLCVQRMRTKQEIQIRSKRPC
uniref:Serine protease inhibitor Kazal-type 4 n=1 Tax=Geotrypetes seraphini TaxID=260995 RepID=A0A6P8NED0_GEOSA|nr:serine protease inhibitor Kazal-type 4 [Geotrypetes seraphini]